MAQGPHLSKDMQLTDWAVRPLSPAQMAGLNVGDRIVRIENVQNPTWEDVLPKVVLAYEHGVVRPGHTGE